MNRDEVSVRQHRDRLLALAETTGTTIPVQKPNNTKRRSGASVTKSPLHFTGSPNKLSIQDFVRADPGYTPNIEHLVFPNRQKCSPVKSASTESSGVRTRSRLAEMFALSRHLHQRSVDRENKHVTKQQTSVRKTIVNRSMDSSMGMSSGIVGGGSGRPEPPRRWATAEEPVHTGAKPANSTSHLSPSTDVERADIMSARGSNVSILHLRSTSEPWETSPTSVFTTASSSRSYGAGSRTSNNAVPMLTKHHSLGAAGNGYQQQQRRKEEPLQAAVSASTTTAITATSSTATTTSAFISGSQVSSGELFACSRELSPVRWCDREVDGVYLGRSGWVQVQQRSLDENKRKNYGSSLVAPATSSLPQSRRPTIKLADYHCNSEPGKKCSNQSRPAYLPLRTSARDVEYNTNLAASSPHSIPESFSPPPITPIISPPPAFQDRVTRTATKARSVYGKPPFLPRSNAIVDSDVISPPASPPPSPPPIAINWSAVPESRPTVGSTAAHTRRMKLAPSSLTGYQSAYNRIPQAKSLEEASTNRRSQFLQRYKDSSSSSSSSLGFRSLDSCVSRPVMPRLSEHTDSMDMYEDADEEDNNSSSLNLSNVSSILLNSSPDSVLERIGSREKTSPSGRSSRLVHHRSQRRSPASSDANKQLTCSSPSSSSSSGSGDGGGVAFPARSPSGSGLPFRRSAPSRQHGASRGGTVSQDEHRVRRSRSLQLPEKRSPGSVITYREHAMKLSPQQQQQQTEAHKFVAKVPNSTERLRRQISQHVNQIHSINNELDEDMIREAEAVTEYLYGSRSRAAAKALLFQRYHDRREDIPPESTKIPNNNGFNIYFVGNTQQRQKVLQRGATTPNITTLNQNYVTSPTTENRNPCNSNTCDFWPHCAQRDSINNSTMFPTSSSSTTTGSMKLSQSYPAHQRSQDTSRVSTPEPQKKRNATNGTMRLSPDNRSANYSAHKIDNNEPYSKLTRHTNAMPERKTSPINPNVNRSPSGGAGNSSSSSSSSDVWVTTSDRTVTKSPRNVKSSGASTPLDDPAVMMSSVRSDQLREMILTRPGSAPADGDDKQPPPLVEAQQRSMSLPKSFLSASSTSSNKQSGQFPCKRQGSENRGLSPSPRHRPPTPEVAHTAPVTPLHEAAVDRRRSPGLTKASRRAKASSTPYLLDQPDWDTNRKWSEKHSSVVVTDSSNQKDMNIASLLTHPRLQATENQPQKNVTGITTESVLQKFRKTFSLRFQKKGSKESCTSDFGDVYVDPSEEDNSPQHVPNSDLVTVAKGTDTSEQKYRFGPLVWRSSKERKKNNKATRSLKCNSGDSGIQIEMVSGISSGGCGTGGDSSESHDTDQQYDGDETDSPHPVRRRRETTSSPSGTTPSARPLSDLLINQILIEKFKTDLQSRAHRHQYVRRTHSDLGGQRLLQWDTKNPYHRMMIPNSLSSMKGRPQRISPKRNPPDAPGGVQLRGPHRNCRPQLRRSLSQPVDMDKLSPLMRTRTAGLRLLGTNVFSEDEHDGRGGGGTSDDEMMSDSESSVASLSERKKSLELAMDEEMVILAEAVFDHVAIEAEELAFRAGDVIEVLETVNRDWWWGSCNGRKGWLPAAFVRLRVSQEDTVEDCLAAMASGKTTSKQLRRRTSISLLSNEQVRTSVVRELVHTERDFVKVLTDVVEGYIAECCRRKDMFTPEQIQTIFINLEDMLKFQSGFLKDLESCIDWDAPHKSCVGNCFLKHRAGFRMYSDYCNHHPMATATLQELYQFNNYSKFFEACRLMRGLIEIPLDGYLLTPIQRICKYPLQLAELLKYTKTEHPDYEQIKEALGAMRDVAVLINERKRRMESLEKLYAWQQRVEGWEGEDLIEVSSQLIYQGEVIRVTSGMWTNNITLFLFDHQIVYCKKDILKRNTHVYKGRLCLDTSEIIDIPDGKDPQLGVSVRHGIKVYSCIRDKWLLFCCRSVSEKQKWLEAFVQERKLVAQDRDEGLEFPAAARQLAKIAARCQRRPPSKPRSGKNYKRDSAYMGSILQINAHSSNSLGRKVGTWFTFSSNKKTRHHDQIS